MGLSPIIVSRPAAFDGLQFRPDIAMLMPFGRRLHGGMQFGLVERAVAVWADHRDAWWSEERGRAPSASFNRHAQAAQADAAAAALVPDDESDEAEADQPEQKHQHGPSKVLMTADAHVKEGFRARQPCDQ